MTIIPHKQLDNQILDKIIEIKQKSWPYSKESHLKWIEDNIKDDDLHFLVTDNNDYVAYMNLVSLLLEINSKTKKAYGIGNVVSIKQGAGYGKMIMESINQYLIENNSIGFLFCKSNLVSFYEKYCWSVLDKDIVAISALERQKEHIYSMIFNIPYDIDKIVYEGKLF